VSCASAGGFNASGAADCLALWHRSLRVGGIVFLDVYGHLTGEFCFCTVMCQQALVTRAALQQCIALPALYDAEQLCGVIESTAQARKNNQ